jgi:PmbA protein
MSAVNGGEQTTEQAAEAAVALCRSRSFEFEVFAFSREATRARLDSSDTRWASHRGIRGLFVRVATDGKVGVGYASDLSGSAIRRCVDSAKKLARHREAEVGWPGFPSGGRSYPTVRGMLDPSLLHADIGQLAEIADLMSEAAVSEGPHVSLSWADVEREISSVAIANSNGVMASCDSAKLLAACSTVNGQGDTISPECIDSQASRSLVFDPAKIGSRAGRLAASSAGAIKAKTQECEVVFANGALGFPEAGLLSVVLNEALSGGNLMRGSTFLSGRMGDRIASRHVNIADSPTAPNRCGSRPFDDEGMATRRLRLVEGGVLRSFVWDHRYASAAGRRSSGNAIRNMASGSVFPRPVNIDFGAGRGDLDSLISEVDDGLLIWGCQGGHTSDAETGDFSFVPSPCFRIRQGDIVGGIRGAMVSGNILGLLSNVSAVGADVRDYGNTLVPSMLVKDVRITSG